MELKIDFKSNEECSVIIYDLTEDYLPENSSITVKNKFKYSETSSISILTLNRSDGEVIKKPVFSSHKDHLKNILLEVESDGWYTINHITLPNKIWFDKELSKKEGSAIHLYDTVYYTDGIDIYKYFNQSSSKVKIEEVLERNTEDTTISRICENYVSICFLNKCYISLSKEILNKAAHKLCCETSFESDDLNYRRDLVWMAINVIKYLVELNQLAEAQRIIEKLEGCNGLCKNEFKQIPTHRCGCGK